jgi:hypothetical protein
MKLSTIKQTLGNSIPMLKSLTQVQGSSALFIKFGNFEKFKQAVNEIKQLNIFDSEINNIEKQKFFLREGDNIELASSEARIFTSQVKQLLEAVQLLYKTLDKVIIQNEKNDQNSIFIKLPVVNDLAELTAEIEIFNKILLLTILDPKIGGQILLETVEPGSVWLKINLGVASAVTLIGSLTWSSAVVYKKYQEGKLMEELVNQQKLENKNRENIINATKVLTDFVIQAEAQNIYNSYYQDGEVDNEQIERIKVSIKMLSEEIHKGAEINPSLTAPEDVTNLFPDMKSLPSIESKIKKIGNE